MFPIELQKASIVRKNGNGEQEIALNYDLFKAILRAAASTIAYDEAWYLGRYKDVAAAVKAGDWKSGREHFINQGYLENRLPYNILVDEKFYLEANPDVAAGVAKGELSDAQQHFDRSGYLEGRLPYDGFTLFNSQNTQAVPAPADAPIREQRQEKRASGNGSPGVLQRA